MSRVFQIIDQLKDKLEKLKPLKSEYQSKLDKKFRLEFNYNSNHLEGNTLTYGETELLLIFDDTKGNHTLREYEEMKAHDVAYQLIEDWAMDTERPLSEQNIKNLNEIILVRPFYKEAITPDGQNTRRLISIGNYKEHPNSVRLANGEIFDYASPTDTPIEMQELIQWYRDEEDAIHPVTLAAMLHYKFVRIHPFDDGNGRVSRLLMNYVLLKNGFPPIIVQASDKQNYLSALHLADIGDFEPFIEYIGKQVIWSLELSFKAANGESLDEAGDLDKKLFVLKKKLKQDNEVKVKLNEDVFSKISGEIIIPLCHKWIKTQQKFDSFFHSSQFSIESHEYEITGQLEVNQFNIHYDKMLNDLNYYHQTFPNILRFSSQFKKLITSKIDDIFFGGLLEIKFYQNVYEISYSGSKNKISKLYNEELKEDEMNTIIESIGNVLLCEIELANHFEKGGSDNF
jgi:Fic family protein